MTAAASRAAPRSASSAQASANANERRGDLVRKLGSNRPKAGPLNVLGSNRTRPDGTQCAVRLPQFPRTEIGQTTLNMPLTVTEVTRW